MIQPKQKLCDGCNTLKLIWKTSERKRYCKDCWYKNLKPKDGTKKTNKQSKPLRSKSSKLAALEQLYSKLRKDYLESHITCEARLPGCSVNATDIHHKKGRGPFLLDIASWISVCRSCHTWIELNPNEAKELNLSEQRL
jgi:hypothetical protein